MKQRVAIARAFATDADLILMDEPFVSLDQPTRERMQREVLNIWERSQAHHRVRHTQFGGSGLSGRPRDHSVGKPARIRADMEVTLPRPRNPLSMEFTALRAQFANLLNAAVPAGIGG